MPKNNIAKFAYVHYASPEDAKAALTAFGNCSGGLKVEAYKTKEEVEQSRAAEKLAQTMSHMVCKIVVFECNLKLVTATMII